MSSRPSQQQPQGFYANPNSPIASTPDVSKLKRARKPHTATNTNNATTSTVQHQKVSTKQPPSSAVVPGPSPPLTQPLPLPPPTTTATTTTTESWSTTLFSPMLSLFSNTTSTNNAMDDTKEDDEQDIVVDPRHAITTTTTTTTQQGTTRWDDSDSEEIHHHMTPHCHEELQHDSEVEEEDDSALQHLLEFDPFLFIAQLPPYESVCDAVRYLSGLPAQSLTHQNTGHKRHALVLDLDETLVHCTSEPTPTYDITFSVDFNGTSCQVFVKKRPHLDVFLEAVSKLFEVTVFTASQQVYAERLLDILDPQKRLVHHRLYRDSCLMVQGNLLKDLNVLSRDLAKTVIVDNSIHAFGYHTCNGIPIESWFDNENDTELLKLLPFLQRLNNVDDVRPHIRESFGVGEMVRRAANSLQMQYQQQQQQHLRHMMEEEGEDTGGEARHNDYEMDDDDDFRIGGTR